MPNIVWNVGHSKSSNTHAPDAGFLPRSTYIRACTACSQDKPHVYVLLITVDTGKTHDNTPPRTKCHWDYSWLSRQWGACKRQAVLLWRYADQIFPKS